MSFSFNFNVCGEEKCGKDESSDIVGEAVDSENYSGALDPETRDSEEINVDWDGMNPCLEETESISISPEVTLKVVNSKKVHVSESSDIARSSQENSDLIPHVYEGGMKIWECSVDLAMYMSSLQIAYRGLRVIELGCGAALPGVVVYKKGANVTFQDYNKDVLTLITAPNILLNSDDTTIHTPSMCRILAGDWAKVQDTLSEQNEKYDIILTSETIYSRDSYQKLHDIMAALLAPNGTIYLAAKTYYFGVGGGTRDFEDYLDKRGVFEHQVCKEYTEGVKREILKLQFFKS